MEENEMILMVKNISQKAVEKIKDVDGGNFRQCLGCGKCAGSCSPGIRTQMDLAPWRLVHLLTLGGKEEMEQVLTSQTIWFCIACSACVSRCPMKINMPKIMEVLRNVILRGGRDFLVLREIPEDVLEKIPQIAVIAAFRKLTG